MEKAKAAFNPSKDVTLGKKDVNDKEDMKDGFHHEEQIESSLGGGDEHADITDKDLTAEGPHGENTATSLANREQQAAADVKPGHKA